MNFRILAFSKTIWLFRKNLGHTGRHINMLHIIYTAASGICPLKFSHPHQCHSTILAVLYFSKKFDWNTGNPLSLNNLKKQGKKSTFVNR
ncbi:MAG: hypothetical protein B6D64_04745 [Bacteroidetes bacterium 4484_276]|nr:MAG: hypothetical protein B6D64_04745 [Bacteroidetes bacterium 4484_276]